jgi:hypothetical protein
MLSKLAVAIALLGGTAVTATTPSLAATAHHRHVQQPARGAFTQTSDFGRRVRADDPPGSAYQDERQAESDGYPG